MQTLLCSNVYPSILPFLCLILQFLISLSLSTEDEHLNMLVEHLIDRCSISTCCDEDESVLFSQVARHFSANFARLLFASCIDYFKLLFA